MLKNYIDIDKSTEEKFEKLYELVISSSVNVTAIKSRDDFLLKHLLDSIYYFYLKKFNITTVVDIGSGGGFPGLALAIIFPEWKVTLVDSIGKKCRFMEDSALQLNLLNVTVVNARGENFKGHTFDLITARGVGAVKEVLGYTYHLAHNKSMWLMYKGEKVTDELNEAKAELEKRGLESEITRIETPFTRSYLRMHFKCSAG